MKCKVFKESVGWSEGLFFFGPDFKFSDIKNNRQTHFLDKSNYLGEFEFDINFLSILDKNIYEGKTYWFEYMYEHNSSVSEENKAGLEKPVVISTFSPPSREDDFKEESLF